MEGLAGGVWSGFMVVRRGLDGDGGVATRGSAAWASGAGGLEDGQGSVAWEQGCVVVKLTLEMGSRLRRG